MLSLLQSSGSGTSLQPWIIVLIVVLGLLGLLALLTLCFLWCFCCLCPSVSSSSTALHGVQGSRTAALHALNGHHDPAIVAYLLKRMWCRSQAGRCVSGRWLHLHLPNKTNCQPWLPARDTR